MTIDERLNRLTERHEALAQTVELLSLEIRQQAETVDALVKQISDLQDIIRTHESRGGHLES